jgi:hypothetical protein
MPGAVVSRIHSNRPYQLRNEPNQTRWSRDLDYGIFPPLLVPREWAGPHAAEEPCATVRQHYVASFRARGRPCLSCLERELGARTNNCRIANTSNPRSTRLAGLTDCSLAAHMFVPPYVLRTLR